MWFKQPYSFFMVSNTLVTMQRKWRLCCLTSELEVVNQRPTSLLLLILPLFTEMVKTLTPFMPMTVRCQSLFCNVWASSWKTKIKGKVVFHVLLLFKSNYNQELFSTFISVDWILNVSSVIILWIAVRATFTFCIDKAKVHMDRWRQLMSLILFLSSD